MKREEKGSGLINYLEKAATDLGYTQTKHIQLGCIAVIPILEADNGVNISFFSPVSKMLHLYTAKFLIRVNKNGNYSSLEVRYELMVSQKKIKTLSQKLESKIEEILQSK